MPEKTNDRTIFTLSEVSLSIQKTLAERYNSSFWIKAEMNKLNRYPQSGHCYPDLVEKRDGKIVAEMRSTIWKDDYQRINNTFLDVLHEPLKNGINILFCAKISYSPLHGLSLRILDIDPSWSLGELEKEKQETIERVRKEGIFARNKSLALPLLPKRIAVISVDTSKGYADFRKIIDHNDWGYGFFHMLFPALLQGENAVASILGQLERVRIVKSHFDAVAIIRGGGGDIGLTCYNNYELVKAVAMFPLPVITGIGHSTNETVTEMVSFKNAITPTDLADFLIQKFHNFSVPLKNAQDIILNRFNRLILDEKSRIMTTVRHFKTETFSRLAQNRYEIKQEVSSLHRQAVFYVKQHRVKHILQNLMRIETGSTNIFRTQKRAIDHSQRTAIPLVAGMIRDRMKDISGIEKNIELLNPMNILHRGYSITLVNGKAVKTIKQVEQGAMMTTILADGIIGSTANTVNKHETHD